MDSAELLRSAAGDGRALIEVAGTGWDAEVPHCPGWDAARLVQHMGSVMSWMAAIVSSGERVRRRDLEPAPDGTAELPGWYQATLDRALAVLGSADPAAQVWTFSSTGDRRVAWWHRRLAAEIAVHRWDAESAAAPTAPGGPVPAPLDGDVAGAAVAEFVTEFLPGLLSAGEAGRPGGSLHLHATDGPTEWWIDLDAGGTAAPRHAKADTAVRGTRSDLLLWLMNRDASGSLQIMGGQEIPARWKHIRL